MLALVVSSVTIIARIPTCSGKLLQDAEAYSLAGTSASSSQTDTVNVPVCEKGIMRKEHEEFLERVKKEAPELIEAEANKGVFEQVLKRLIHAPPEPKKKRKTESKDGILRDRRKQGPNR